MARLTINRSISPEGIAAARYSLLSSCGVDPRTTRFDLTWLFMESRLVPSSPDTASGFGDIALGMKQQRGPLRGGFDLSVIAALSLPPEQIAFRATASIRSSSFRGPKILEPAGPLAVCNPPRQQIDFHFGFGLSHTAPRRFFAVGYSFRIDGAWHQ